MAGNRWELLLKPLARNGECVLTESQRSANEARKRAFAGLESLDETQKRVLNPHTYPVGLEKDLFIRRADLVKEMRGYK